MEARKFKLQYFSRTARYLYSVKSVDNPAIGTFISASLAKMTPDPPYRLVVKRQKSHSENNLALPTSSKNITMLPIVVKILIISINKYKSS